jgi:peroxiredoxin
MQARKSVKGLFAIAAASALVAVGLAAAQPKDSADKEHKQEQKVATVGEPAPDFTITDLDGKEHTLSELTKQGKIVVLEWFNPNCPYIIKHHVKFKTMNDIATEYKDKDVVWLAINSGAEGKQGASEDLNREKAKEYGLVFPLSLDADGTVGKAYGAKATPHMFVIDADGVLRYKGAIDNDRSADTVGDVNYVRQALDEILAGQTVSEPETRPYGCSIKYPL